MDLARQYGPLVKLRLPQGYAAAVACPRLQGDIYRHADDIPPDRGLVAPWVLYFESENKPKALLTS